MILCLFLRTFFPKVNSFLVLLSFLLRIGFSFSEDIKAVVLKTEYLYNPLAVDILEPRLEPRLSWILEATDQTKQNLSQKAYQILVATDKQSLAKNTGNLWDSKKVISDRNIHIKYNGFKLCSGERAYWVVRVWDQNDKPSQYSSVAFWDKGLSMNDWTAQWIGAPKDTQFKALQNLSDIDSKVKTIFIKVFINFIIDFTVN